MEYHNFDHKRISLEKLIIATDNFADENLIGQGGFGKVYRGRVKLSGIPTDIAARKLHFEYGQGDMEFWKEISIFANRKNIFKHGNIVSFIGFCNEKDMKIVIYKFEPKGSLDKHLSDPKTLTWMQRLHICVGVARALKYIYDDHGSHDSSIIHRNIKSSKILLDDKWKPKLSGFEHSKTNTRARKNRLVLADIIGTLGYVDPTYEKTGFVSHKSDIFSFGVVLFEVLCGRRAYIPNEQEKHSPQFFEKDEIAVVQGVRGPSNFYKYRQILVTALENPDPKDTTAPRKKSSVDRKHQPSVHSIRSEALSIYHMGGQARSFTRGVQVKSFTRGKAKSFSRSRAEKSFADQVHKWPTRPPRAILKMYKPNDQTPSSPADNILPKQSASNLKEKSFQLYPLFTMKRLDQYLHSPTEVLLPQMAKSHYEEGKLDDLINPDLRKQMDIESYKIFASTAYNCLKEQRAQRPNIDQILSNLVKALQLQKRHQNPGHRVVADEAEGTSSSDPLKKWKLKHLMIPLSDIELATDNFTKIFLGAGAFGKVYAAELELPIDAENKYELPKKQKKTVAIKCLAKNKQGEAGFMTEIELLTRCKHPNIVSLLGFCNEGHELILVYEYLSNGSLDNYLEMPYNLNNLTWVQRLNISIDIARGLNYLHTTGEDEQSIIHRDVKSGNILLGKNWTAKIADFGLSRFHDVNGLEKTHYSKNIAGTRVYMCPEYMKEGKLKRAIDIYSFGVVLFEILSGKVAYDFIYLKENEDGIAYVARRLFKEGRLNQLVDPQIMEEVDELTSNLYKGPNRESLATFIAIAHQCVAETQKERPAADKILKELEKALMSQEINKHPLQMSLEEIKSATADFSRENFIGGGGFGRVYKGEITRGDEHNTIVAKRLDRREGQGEYEFLMELEVLFEYKHENIIALAGYCNKQDERIIIYEYASRESLDRQLKNPTLRWTQRLKICIDVARGLAFLHGGALTREMVIHRDIKCANILLTGDWKAKISDFGLSAITAIDQEVVSDLVGTRGYVDPVYDNTGFFTEKSDIYSFGVVLFEVLSGKLLVPNTKVYNEQHVANILKQIHEEGKLDSIVFKDMKDDIVPRSLSAFRAIVSQCIDYDRTKRPTAKEVLLKLQKALELQVSYHRFTGLQ